MSVIPASDFAGAKGTGSNDDVSGAGNGSGFIAGRGGLGGNNLNDRRSNSPGKGSVKTERSGARRGARRGDEEGPGRSETERIDRGGVVTAVPRSNAQQQHTGTHNLTVDPTRVVKRPIPQDRSTRQFQLLQLQRRFGLEGDYGANSTTEFTINLIPSDPEFPYAVDVLKFVLIVPLEYGATMSDGKADGIDAFDEENRPTIRILNEDIPVGFKINIQNGFREIVTKTSKTTTLLDMVNMLDRRLEKFLAVEKATTIKIIPNAPSKASPSSGLATYNVASTRGGTMPDLLQTYTERPTVPRSFSPKVPRVQTYTQDEIAAAAAKRAQDVRQLEARLGRSEVYSKTEAPDGELIYTVPLEARRKDLLPVPLWSMRSVILRVPKMFNLEPCAIKITGIGITRDVSEPLEKKFAQQVKANPNWSLMAHLNALAANLHAMATGSMEEKGEAEEKRRKHEEEKWLVEELEKKAIIDDIETGRLNVGKGNLDLVKGEREHIVVIPRPPEWSYVGDGDGSGTDTEDDSEFEENLEEGDEKPDVGTSHSRERGTALSFPGIQMPGIQLLEALFVNVTVKCTKCKTTVDVMQIRPGGKPRFDRCEKCSGIYGIGFRMEPVHQFSNRAGFFDLAGCTITDILPSNFLPHCASCDTPLPPPGMANLVPGQTLSTNCRQCHLKMSLFIPEIKLLRISQDDDATLEAPHGSLPAKKAKKDEKLIAGTELPNQGKCVHYRKSTRWFRFSCCLKVYPCDKCHDEQQPSHPAEHANRMICGRCSREQNYRPNDCAYCGHEFMRKATGYWEGGKGTRDKRLLRRNDPRKYKRVKKPVPEK